MFLKKSLLFICFYFLQISAFIAADYYWIGGSGNWSDPQKWALSSGGTPAGTIPTGFDNAIFDGQSFSLPNQQVVINDSTSINLMDWSLCTNSPELILDTNLFINGNITFHPNMSVHSNNIAFRIQFLAQSSFNPNGALIDCNISIYLNNDIETIDLNNNLLMSDSSTIFLMKGEFKTNNNTITSGIINIVDVDSISKKSLTLGSSEINLSIGFYALNIIDSNFTFNAGISLISIGDSNYVNYLNSDSLTFYDIHLNFDTTSSQQTLKGNNIYNKLIIKKGSKIKIDSASIHTVNDSLIFSGTCVDSIYLYSSNPSFAAIFNKSSSNDVFSECVNFHGISFSNSSLTTYFSKDQGNNNNINFNSSSSVNANFNVLGPFCLGDTTFFTNTSTCFSGNSNDFNSIWYFNDGSGYYLNPPLDSTWISYVNDTNAHVFIQNGDFSVSLITTYKNFCKDTATTLVHINDPSIYLYTASDTNICAGTEVSFEASSGVSGAEFEFFHNGISQNNPSINDTIFTINSLSNNDSVSVFAYENGCVSSSKPSYTFVVTPSPTYSWSSNDPDTTICSLDSVSFSASSIDTTYLYQFLINNSGVTSYTSTPSYTTNSILNNDTLQLVVKDTLNCTDTSFMVFNVNPLPTTTLSESSGSNVICNGQAITFTATGADMYEFFVNGVSQTGLSSSNTFVTSSLNSGDSVTVIGETNNGCVKQADEIFSYTVNPLPNVGLTFNSIDTTICSGENVIFNASGASIYEFFINGISQGSASSFSTLNTTTLNHLDTVYVIGTFSGCSNYTDSAVFTVNTSPTTTLICDDIDAIICSQTLVNFTASGANLYEFFVDGVSQGAPSTSSIFSTSSLTNNQTVSVTGESNTCSVSQSIQFSVLPSPSVGFFSNDPNNSICEGETITFTCANADQYELFVNGNSQGAPQNNSIFTPNLPNGIDSLYIIGTALNGCTDTSQSIIVTVTPLPSISLTSSDIDNIFCSGESVTFTASGANFFQFVIDGVPQGSLSTTNSLTTTGISNGQTIYAIGSTLGCTSNSNSINNTVNQNPNVNLASNDINNVFCQDQIVTFSASGASSYEFIVNGISQGNPSSIDTLNSSNFAIGNYSVTVNGEQNNCTGSASIQVTVNQVPSANLISSDIDNIICQGEMVTYTSTGANLFEFFVNGISQGAPSPINTFSTSSLNNGEIVSVVSSSSNGCSNSSAYAAITVNSNPIISLSSIPSNQQICLNDTVILNASGGSLYEFFVDGISQGAPSSSPSISISSIANGNNVYVQGTQTGCSALSNTLNYTVFNNPSVSLINNEDSLLCDFESTNLIATGANEYQFLINGIQIGPYSSIDTLATLLANGDVVSVNGQTNGCSSISNNTISFTVFNTPIISTVCSDLDTIICLNDSVHFTSSGASEYLFELNGSSLQNSALNTFYINNLNQNDTLKITGYNGHCSSNSNTYIFTVNSMNLNSSISPSTLICEGDLVTINASGGDLYEFFVNGNSVSSLSSQSNYSSSSLNNLDKITYNAYSNSTSCLQENNDFISISVITTPSFNVLPNPTFCDGDSVSLNSNSSHGNQWLLNGNPIQSANDTSYTSYVSGDYSLEVLAGGNGEVYSIGQNANGIFGNGNNLNSSSPTKSPYYSNFSSLSSGFDFITGVDSSGNAYSWGNNSSGQLGDGTFTNSNIPNLIASLSDIKFVSTSSSSCMAISNNGEVYVWGNNSEGQLSTGNTSVINFPFLNTNINNVDTVAAGKNHFILLKNDSTVWSVGNNDFGQLGQGNLVSQNNAQQILALNNIVKIGAGEYHSFAINSNGKLYVWGNNSSGQLGLNDYNNRLSPALSPLQGIIQAEGGASHSVFLKNNHKTYATGDNSFGQLGLGNQNSIISPQEIPINGVKMISISQNTSLFLRNDYSVYGCGNNLENQIDSSSMNIINTPKRISEIYGIGSIEASKSSSHFIANNLKSCVSPIVTITALSNPIVSINSIGDTLTCTTGSNYQWYFNGSMIPGANSSTFIANGSGNYSVLVTFANGCSNMSPDLFHSMSNLLEFDYNNSKVSIYPNPAKDYLEIKLDGNKQEFQKILITDVFGRIVRIITAKEVQNNSLSLKKMENGYYNLILIHSKGKIVKRFIKN